uniref:Uncharacterized protein n=1 Tax=Caulobacter phage BL57 TaxID=3348355 RepID=A0AB74UGI6_9VIRU
MGGLPGRASSGKVTWLTPGCQDSRHSGRDSPRFPLDGRFGPV